MSDIYLCLRDVWMTFEGQTGADDGLKSWLTRRLIKGPVAPESYRVEALRNINLTIKQGERVGLVGLNGAGKSTLLKVMAGIYPPTAGKVEKRGHICPMFEFATGFEMNQSGWDNIRIRGLLLGMSPDEIEAKLPEIAEFTELGEFLSYPVRTYSSGMFIRLAFAVSTSINPEILLLDEVMGAGDIRFAEKAKRRMVEFMEQGRSWCSPRTVSICSALFVKGRSGWIKGKWWAMGGPLRLQRCIAGWPHSNGPGQSSRCNVHYGGWNPVGNASYKVTWVDCILNRNVESEMGVANDPPLSFVEHHLDDFVRRGVCVRLVRDEDARTNQGALTCRLLSLAPSGQSAGLTQPVQCPLARLSIQRESVPSTCVLRNASMVQAVH